MPSSITRLAISALTYLILALILKRFITNRIIQNRNNLEVITFTSVMTFLIYFIIISVERFVATEHAMEKTNFLFITFYGIASTIIAASVIFIMNKNYKAKNREIELKQLISYSKKIEINYNELRKFKHDYMNILLSLEGFIQDNNLHSLKEYFYSTIKTSNNIFDKNLLNLSQLSNLEILELKGLITGKLMDAMQNKVQITVEIPEQINSFPIPSLDLVRVIGIILDNAIEATVNTNNSFIRFAIIPIKNSQLVIVSNSCTNSTPPLHKIKKNGYSTKGDNRGIGLSNLDDLIAKYPIVSLDTKIENNCFTQKICIKNGGQHA
ncbi:GHKL domain-containing protein [Carnobacterium divergens]|nr:GHKL domain-containing protein [Carnobacterium divergens]MDT1951493.1 GHKL domain-containing protein [Carnobacterium divergens]MDT1961860.1 GHKL domain-containing protein [Carnobacterium divergens]